VLNLRYIIVYCEVSMWWLMWKTLDWGINPNQVGWACDRLIIQMSINIPHTLRRIYLCLIAFRLCFNINTLKLRSIIICLITALLEVIIIQLHLLWLPFNVFGDIYRGHKLFGIIWNTALIWIVRCGVIALLLLMQDLTIVLSALVFRFFL